MRVIELAENENIAYFLLPAVAQWEKHLLQLS